MNAARLSPLDSSFLAVESSTAHMHVGWAALFCRTPSPRGLRTAARASDTGSTALRATDRNSRWCLRRSQPVWIDDDRFDLGRPFTGRPPGYWRRDR
jgi:hypothetical protein